MRAIQILPLVAAVLLSACGSKEKSGEAVTSAKIASEAGDLIKPRPGQYRSSLELLEFNAPGMPDGVKAQMKKTFASGLAEGNTFCMTKENAEKNGAEQMVKNLAESNCEMSKFNVSGNSVVAEMQCSGEGGGIRSVKMEGQMAAESSTMTMEMSQEMPNIGATTMKVRVKSNRIGDCA